MNENSTAPATENTSEVATPAAVAEPGATNPTATSSHENEPVAQQKTLLDGAPSEKAPEPPQDGSKAEDGENAKEETETESEQTKEEGAPEQYESFKAPEGVKLDNEVMNQFGEVAKKLNLSQEKAQSLIDAVSPVLAKRQLETIANVSNQWAEKSKTIPEIADHMSDVARLRDKFAYNSDGQIDADIAEFMSSPAGNHPGVLKLLARAGRAFGEAGVPRGTSAGPETITAKDIYSKH